VPPPCRRGSRRRRPERVACEACGPEGRGVGRTTSIRSGTSRIVAPVEVTAEDAQARGVAAEVRLPIEPRFTSKSSTGCSGDHEACPAIPAPARGAPSPPDLHRGEAEGSRPPGASPRRRRSRSRRSVVRRSNRTRSRSSRTMTSSFFCPRASSRRSGPAGGGSPSRGGARPAGRSRAPRTRRARGHGLPIERCDDDARA
jgi:hypothetical protein